MTRSVGNRSGKMLPFTCEGANKLPWSNDFLDEVLAIISLKDEVDQVKKKRQTVQEKIRRMTKVYMDGLSPDEEYHRQKELLEMEL